MSDPIDSLRAALDEAEDQARAAADNDGNLEWCVSHARLAGRHSVRTASARPVLRAYESDSAANEDGEFNPTATFDPALTSEHAARWDPSTVLRLIARDRALLVDHDPYTDEDTGGRLCVYDGFGWPCDEVLRAEAFWLPKDDGRSTE